MPSGFAVGWRQVAASLAMMAAAAMVSSGYSVIAVPLGAEFHPSRMVLMLTMTIMSLVAGLTSPLFGTLMDRVSVRLLMAIGTALIVTGYVALSFATTFTQVLVIYALFMAPVNILLGPMAATVLLSRWFVKRRGTALGIAISGVALGGFVYPPLTQLLLDHFHWREAMRLLALILALTTIPAVLAVVDRPAQRGLHPDGMAIGAEGARPEAAPVAFSARELVADPAFWILGAICAVVMSGMLGMVTNLMPLAIDQGVTPTSASLLISVYAGGGFIAKLAFAAIADKLNPRSLIFLSVAGFASGMACLIGAELGYPMIFLGVGLIGLFGGVMVPMQGLLIPRIFGQEVVGRVSGTLNLVVLSALLATPPIFGLIFDVTGNYDAIFVTFVCLAVGIMLLVPYLRLHPRAASAEPTAVAAAAEV